VLLEFDAARLRAEVEKVPLQDERLSRVWGEHVHRVVISARSPRERDSWTLRARLDPL
jgi:hypothetical protein